MALKHGLDYATSKESNKSDDGVSYASIIERNSRHLARVPLMHAGDLLLIENLELLVDEIDIRALGMQAPRQHARTIVDRPSELAFLSGAAVQESRPWASLTESHAVLECIHHRHHGGGFQRAVRRSASLCSAHTGRASNGGR
jgi:hypothetical protein